MYCPNCGRENPDGVGFCGGCGMSFAASVPAAPAPAAPAPQPAAAPVEAAPAPQTAAAPVEAAPQPAPAPAAPAPQPAAAPVEAAPAPQPAAAPVEAAPSAAPAAASAVPAAQPQPANQAAPAQPKQPSSMLPFGQHFKNLIKAATHPVTGPAEIVPQYDKIGNALFLAGIVVIICSLVATFTSLSIDLINLARYPRTYGDIIVGMVLKDIFYPFIVYAFRTFGCAGLMLLAGLIVKEKWSFAKLLATASLAVAPAYIIREVLGTYLGLIPYIRLGTLISTAAYIYYIVMLYEGMSAETKLTGNKKAFVLVSVFAIIGVLAGLFSY